MEVRSITYIDDLISINSIVTVYYIKLAGITDYGESHDFWEFMYVDKGDHRLMLDNVRYDLTEGQLLVYPPNAFHIGTGEPNTSHVAIVSFESDSAALNTLTGKVFTLDSTLKELLSKIITEGVESFVPAPPETGLYGLMRREGVSDYELQKLKHRVEMFLTELCLSDEKSIIKSGGVNCENYKKEQFLQIVDFMNKNISKQISLEDLSNQFSLSISKLKALFKQETGMGVIAYFTFLKITEAKRLIRESSLNFTQISEKTGFNTVHYFSKTFKEKTGITPSEYAKSVYKK